MVTSKETRAAIIALHQSSLTSTKIAFETHVAERTVYRIVKGFRETGSTEVKKASGRPRLSNKRQDRFVVRNALQNRVLSKELAQDWQQAGVSASARTVRRRLLDNGLASRKAAKKPFFTKKNISDRLADEFCRKHKDWVVEDWCKVIFSDEAPF